MEMNEDRKNSRLRYFKNALSTKGNIADRALLH
jgi:hypothetical protein